MKHQLVNLCEEATRSCPVLIFLQSPVQHTGNSKTEELPAEPEEPGSGGGTSMGWGWRGQERDGIQMVSVARKTC